MHQPEYRDPVSGIYHQPWTYLHTIKDYVDMAAHLEAVPEAHAVVNFAPVLLEQIEDYVSQLEEFLDHTGAIRDPLLSALAEPVLPSAGEQRWALIKACLRLNEQRMVDPYPQLRKLVDIARMFETHVDAIEYLGDQFLTDLLVWYHITWLGETVRREDVCVRALMKKGSHFTHHDRCELVRVLYRLIAGIVPRYRALSATGRVELSVSPYAHPIVPLLLDIDSASESMPGTALPSPGVYPGGEQRANWHIDKAIECFEHHFGVRPAGCWPSEGGLSDATVGLLNTHGFRWTASGETVLRNSLNGAMPDSGSDINCQLCRPWRLNDNSTVAFFRDDGLSDAIGFNYSDWHAEDAVANLQHHLENIAEQCAAEPDCIVSIIMDGENAWEFYPHNGFYFLNTLYQQLANNPRFELTTYSAYLDGKPEAPRLSHLVSGSWVYGTFSTWIGDRDKNRGWEMLCDAKSAFDRAMSDGMPEKRRIAAEHQLAICEGSDWFWWFGDYNPADAVSDFDELFRLHLSRLYLLIDVEPPEYLGHAFTHGGGAPALGGTMRRGQQSE
jgi:alpha-amylase/alpha-mannosidase (GH57 family)